MIRLVTAAVLAAMLATPALAQSNPPNNGTNELNDRGTLGPAPSYGGPKGPIDCTAGDPRPDCQQATVPEDRSQDPGASGNGQMEQNGDTSTTPSPNMMPRPQPDQGQ
jgi:hypothetical protein